MNCQIFRLASCTLFVLGCALPAASTDGPAKPDATKQITEITLRRTQCFGRCPIDELVLKADGTAHYAGQMFTARTGDYKGTFWDGEFAQLARWFDTQGFFTMQDSYGNANPDTPDEIISAVHDGQRKTVILHMASPLALWNLERTIQGVAADIAWQPEASGVRGIVTYKPKATPAFPEPLAFRPFAKRTLIVRSAGEQPAFTLQTDEAGRFEMPLRPGTYSVEVLNYWSDYHTAVNPQQQVVVAPDKFSEVAIKIDRSADAAKP